VTFTYKAGGNVIAISGPLTTTPAACGSASISAEFSLTSAGKKVILD